MRKLTVPIAAAAVVAAGSGITIAVIGPSPTAAAPSFVTSSCGSFSGVGPAPDCGFRVTDRTVRVELRNNGSAPVPVVCTLGRVGATQPVASTTLAPKQRGVVSATSALAGAQAYVIDCQSAVPVGKEVSRTAVFTARFAAPERRTPTRSQFVRPAPPERTASPTVTLPAPPRRTTTTITPTLTEEPSPSAPVRPLVPTDEPPRTTTTTTTPPVG
ncbi:hypothetical protein [Gordonia sp. OPL2]|uniref:hypothetical protein n=1 Tax=Gordonia sp. OPL2 TaxID=2486274 RepID=UPI0016556A86|nr:hypothetical protein [Gordonia sp. OPL2]ROZ98521.1 hypothetical protein EEB19_15160 [Gordonia sp. OPL2]